MSDTSTILAAAMASELTLAEPAHVKLHFEPDNMRNTSISRGRAPLYEVKSAKDFSWTEITTPAGESLVKVTYRTLLPDKVQFGGGEERKLKEWLPDRKEL
jgi:hypothetical protein